MAIKPEDERVRFLIRTDGITLWRKMRKDTVYTKGRDEYLLREMEVERFFLIDLLPMSSDKASGPYRIAYYRKPQRR